MPSGGIMDTLSISSLNFWRHIFVIKPVKLIVWLCIGLCNDAMTIVRHKVKVFLFDALVNKSSISLDLKLPIHYF